MSSLTDCSPGGVLEEEEEEEEEMFPASPCPYPAWSQYLPTSPYGDSCPERSQLTAACNFLSSQNDLLNWKKLEEKKHFYLDVSELLADPKLRVEWPEMEDMLTGRTEVVCGLFGLAMHHLISSIAPASSLPFPLVRARLENYDNLVPLNQLRSNYLHQLVVVQGTVVKVGPLTVLNTWLAWQCVSCRGETVVFQDGGHKPPSRCPHGCRNQRNFVPLRLSRSTVTVDRQVVRLQEVLEEDGGRVPRTVEVELVEDLTDTCIPGDTVRVSGVVRTSEARARKQNKKSDSQFLLYVSAVGLTNSRRRGKPRTVSDLVQFTYNDFALIQDIHSYGPGIMKLLVNSLCPSIFGHFMVKAGLLLGLFGGTVRTERSLPVRSESHILVVGDPGLGKSQMLTAACDMAPRAVLVAGNTSTATGLTAAMAKESGHDVSLEAGALVLADQGVCCIDEFDKMSGQHPALLEAMEQQSISVCKAGVISSMPARVSILATANPAGGRYTKAKTVSENLRLSPALLTRFDLVFLVLDRQNTLQDSLLSEHVLAQHSSAGPSLPAGGQPRGGLQEDGSRPAQPLLQRISLARHEKIDPVPAVCLKKYIAYARRYVHPTLGPGAVTALKTFYVEMRRRHHTKDCVPITTRQLMSLKRLTEARARLELREEAGEQDALDVIEMMKTSMVDTFSDENGVMEFTRGQMGSGMSCRAAAKKFMQILRKASEDQRKSLFSVNEMKRLASMGNVTLKGSFMDLLDSLNIHGYLLKKSAHLYKLLSSNY